MSDDSLEARVERIEDELGIESEELPSFNGHQMVEVLHDGRHENIYRDEEGDVWFEHHSDMDATCLVGDTRETIDDAWDGEYTDEKQWRG